MTSRQRILDHLLWILPILFLVGLTVYAVASTGGFGKPDCYSSKYCAHWGETRPN